MKSGGIFFIYFNLRELTYHRPMHSSLPVINPSRKKILQLKNAIGKSFVHINHHEHLKQLIYCVLDQYSHEEFSMWIKQCVTHHWPLLEKICELFSHFHVSCANHLSTIWDVINHSAAYLTLPLGSTLKPSPKACVDLLLCHHFRHPHINLIMYIYNNIQATFIFLFLIWNEEAVFGFLFDPAVLLSSLNKQTIEFLRAFTCPTTIKKSPSILLLWGWCHPQFPLNQQKWLKTSLIWELQRLESHIFHSPTWSLHH